MKKASIILIPILIILMAFVAGNVEAQTPVSMEVDKTSLSTDEILSLTISVDSSANLSSRPELPFMTDFDVVGTYSGTQMSIINGDMSVQETYTYQLRPTQAGSLLIDSISVNVSGQTYRTEPIQIIVTQGTGVPQQANPTVPNMPSFPSLPSLPSFPSLPSLSAAPAQPIDPSVVPEELNGQDFYAHAVVDNLQPYQGQQVVYTLRFYRSVSLVGQANYQNPSFTGFWTHLNPEQQDFSFSKAGRNYQMTELKTILFPTVVGDVTIDPASFMIPGGIFSQGKEIFSNPIDLNVKPLPDGAPSDFSGAVGQFEVHSLADRTEGKVNETVTWRVTVSGQGNIDKLTDPEWPELTGWRAFDSEASVSTEIVDDKFGGTRTTDRVLVPTDEGILLLPPVNYSYFNPDSGSYATVSSNPIEVKVGPDANASRPAVEIQPDPTRPSEVEQQIDLSDSPLGIRPNKPAEANWTVGSPLVTDRSGYWLLFAVPLALIGGHFAWQLRQQRRLETVDIRRSQQARKSARRSLRAVKRDNPNKYEISGRILSEYLSTRLNRSIAGATQSQVSQLIMGHGIEPDLADKVLRILDICDMGRYSPHVSEMGDEDIVKVVEQLIDELDKSFNQHLSIQ